MSSELDKLDEVYGHAALIVELELSYREYLTKRHEIGTGLKFYNGKPIDKMTAYELKDAIAYFRNAYTGCCE